MLELWYVQYKYEGRWYESCFALEYGKSVDDATRLIKERHTVDCSDFIVWKAGHAASVITVHTAKRIPKKYVRKDYEAVFQGELQPQMEGGYEDERLRAADL